MKMRTEGRLADSVWRVEEKDYSNAAARRPFISCMLHRVSLLLAQSGHSTVEFRCPLLGVKRTSRGHRTMSAFDPKRTCEPTNSWNVLFPGQLPCSRLLMLCSRR